MNGECIQTHCKWLQLQPVAAAVALLLLQPTQQLGLKLLFCTQPFLPSQPFLQPQQCKIVHSLLHCLTRAGESP